MSNRHFRKKKEREKQYIYMEEYDVCVHVQCLYSRT